MDVLEHFGTENYTRRLEDLSQDVLIPHILVISLDIAKMFQFFLIYVLGILERFETENYT